MYLKTRLEGTEVLLCKAIILQGISKSSKLNNTDCCDLGCRFNKKTDL